MHLVEQHRIDRHDSRFAAIDAAAFAAKNLYNAANYLLRQSFIFQGEYLNYYAIHAEIKRHEAYLALPRKVSQHNIIRTVIPDAFRGRGIRGVVVHPVGIAPTY